jgi:hypothetical protein
MRPPAQPKLYHILHYDKLPAISTEGFFLSDAELLARAGVAGTTIGMGNIKERRLKTALSCHPDLKVGSCVPFYFCPRSVMLYVIYQANHPDLAYRGGQTPIVHLEFDLQAVAAWAADNDLRWAFTLGNAGSVFFEDRNRLDQLSEVNWSAVRATQWNSPDIKEGKQAEFLVERCVPWQLVERIVVVNQTVGNHVTAALASAAHRPPVVVERGWYYP